MEAELKYRETSHYYSNKFMRNSKAVGVLWGIFTVCYAIITIVVFMQVGSCSKFHIVQGVSSMSVGATTLP